MRILKRNLAFLMVLAMALGMMVTASATGVADYKDANKIDDNCVEAVDVMSGLGILEGDKDAGTFDPQSTLTREQGAKIIAYLMLGKTAADNLSTSSAPFNDVPANRWSAGFVAYCASQGIVGGYGNGNFGPNDTLTGTQFAKMLLTAVGYGVKDEFTGPNWEIAVNKQALTSKVYEGNLGVNFSAGVKREEAALYAFNTLTTVNTVKYSEVFGDYYSGTSVLTPGVGAKTLGEELYDLKKDNTTADDAFGRTTHGWKAGAKIVGTTYTNKADLVYTDSFTNGALYKDLGLTHWTGGDSITIKVDGAAVTTTFAPAKDGKVRATAATGSGGMGLTNGHGVVTEVYLSETSGNYTVTVLSTNVYAAKVEKYDEKKGEVTVVVLAVDGAHAADNSASKIFKTTVAYEKNDFVLVTMDAANSKIQSVKAANVVSGKLEAVASDYSYVKMDGDKYTVSEKAAILAGVDFKATNELIVDDYGYVLYVNEVEAADEETAGYLYIQDVEYNAKDLRNGSSADVKVLYLDGNGTEILRLASAEKGNSKKVCFKLIGATTAAGANLTTSSSAELANTKVIANDWVEMDNTTVGLLKDKFFAYKLDDDGNLVLKTLDFTKVAVGTGATKLEKKTSITVAGKATTQVNSSSVINFVDGKDVETFTGYKHEVEAKNSSSAGLIVYDTAVTSNLVKTAYIISATKDNTTTEAVYAYYTGKTENVDGGVKVELYVDGESVTYVKDSASDSVNAGDIVVITLNSKNEVKMVKSYGDAKLVTGAAISVSKSAYFTADKNADGTSATTNHYYAEDKAIYDVTDGIKEGSIVEGKTTASFVINKAGEVVLVFITAISQ